MRLQRLMADAGVASRRACEELIESGHVSVNGRTVTRLPVFVDAAADRVEVDGRPLRLKGSPSERNGHGGLRAGRRLYIMLNKPARTLTTTRDDAPEGDRRTTVLDLVDHASGARLFPVGRLDYQTTGLVLLTNDGELAHRLTHARHAVPKTYEALVRRALSRRDLDDMESVLAGTAPSPGGRRAPAAQRAAALAAGDNDRPVKLDLVAHREGEGGQNTLLAITLTEAGPARQVREVLARLGCPVKRLRRTAIGPLVLKGVALGRWRELERAEVGALKRAAGVADHEGAGTPRARGRSPAPAAQESTP